MTSRLRSPDKERLALQIISKRVRVAVNEGFVLPEPTTAGSPSSVLDAAEEGEKQPGLKRSKVVAEPDPEVQRRKAQLEAECAQVERPCSKVPCFQDLPLVRFIIYGLWLGLIGLENRVLNATLI